MIFLFFIEVLGFAALVYDKLLNGISTTQLRALGSFIIAACSVVLVHILCLFVGISFILFHCVLVCGILLLLYFYRARIFYLVKNVFAKGSKRKIISGVIAGLTVITFILFQVRSTENVKIIFILSADAPDRFQLFYKTFPGEEFTEQKSQFATIKGGNIRESVEFAFPTNISIQGLRLDPGDKSVDNEIQFRQLIIVTAEDSIRFSERDLSGAFDANQFITDLGNGHIKLKSGAGFDPWVIFTKGFLKRCESESTRKYYLLKFFWWGTLFICVLIVILLMSKLDWRVDFNTLFLACSLIFATLFFIKDSFRWGEWDAWAIWTMHAKFLMASNWQLLFSGDIPWSHADYPLLLPDLIAVLGRCSGTITPTIPAAVALIVMLLIFAVLFYSLQPNRYMAVIGVICLIIHPTFFKLSATQYADTPLALLYLLSIILLIKSNTDRKLLLATGLAASLCVWIKDEGYIFFGIFSFVVTLRYFRSIKEIRPYFIGAVIPILMLMVFKNFFAPSISMIHNIHGEIWTKLCDPDRYLTIANSFWTLMLRDNKILIAGLIIAAGTLISRLKTNYMLMIIGILVLAVSGLFYASAGMLIFLLIMCIILLLSFTTLRKGELSLIFIPVTTLFCYLSVYVITPHGLTWHIDTSLNRLIHQLYPCITYVVLAELSNRWKREETIVVVT